MPLWVKSLAAAVPPNVRVAISFSFTDEKKEPQDLVLTEAVALFGALRVLRYVCCLTTPL